jgi:hypothetical protein
VNNYQKTEEIFDEKGNVAIVRRGDIVRAYIKHIYRWQSINSNAGLKIYIYPALLSLNSSL